MVKLSERQVNQMSTDELKKWLIDRNQKLPKTSRERRYYAERVLEYQSAHAEEDVDPAPRGRRSRRNTPNRVVNKRKTPIRGRRHSEMPAGYSDSTTPSNKPARYEGRLTRSRRRTLNPGDLDRGEDKKKSNPSRKKRGLAISKPARDMKKAELQEWLTRNGIVYPSGMLKPKLVELVEKHAMAPPGTPPKRQRTISHGEGKPPPPPGVTHVRKSPKRQLDDKTKPKAKRARVSYHSSALRDLMDSGDDDGDEKMADNKDDALYGEEKPPVTPRGAPLPPNLDLSPLTPQHQRQNTVEKQGSSSPTMGNDSLLTTPEISRYAREHGAKRVPEDTSSQYRSEIRQFMDYALPTSPSRSLDNDIEPTPQYPKPAPRSNRQERDSLARNLDFRRRDDSEDEKNALMQSTIPKPPPEIMDPLTHRPKKKLSRRASDPIPQRVQHSPHTVVGFNPKRTGKRPKKESSALNILLGSVLIGVVAFVIFVFLNLENGARFCDTNKVTIGGMGHDDDGNPMPCTPCPEKATCTNGVAVCDTQYILMGTDCVLNKAVVQAGYEVRSQVSEILGHAYGQHACGEDVARGYTENQLKDLIVLTDPTMIDEAFEYFKVHVLPNTSTLRMEKGLYVSTRPIKSVSCIVKEWVSDNKLLVCAASFFVLSALSVLVRMRRQRWDRQTAEALKSQVMEALQDRAQSSRQDKFLPVDTLKNEFRPPSETVWKMVVEMMKHEHNVVKRQEMVQGVQRSCWEMANVGVHRRQPRRSLDSALQHRWNERQQTDRFYTNVLTQQPPISGVGQVPAHGVSPTQREGADRSGDVTASQLFDQNRRQGAQYSTQDFFASGTQHGGDGGQGFELRGQQYPVTSARDSNW